MKPRRRVLWAERVAQVHGPGGTPRQERRAWTEDEEARLRAGFARYGRAWERIRDRCGFSGADGRTNVNLKDKARNLGLTRPPPLPSTAPPGTFQPLLVEDVD